MSSLSSYCLSCGKKKTYSLPYVPSVSYGTRAERNYSTNQSKNYSTNQSKNYSSDPWFITGLFDAEGSFVITILNNSRYKTGWNVQARIQIKMHERDRAAGARSAPRCKGGRPFGAPPRFNSINSRLFSEV
uniref:LAGLIDADG endonuclease n=1 Tax=Morchella brunnea TaxID=1174671 RepID=A0A8K1I7Z2_9PEZI|nr:LAGLIDADG endonuclease [Morchella brunnea]UBU98578.1 LAGLIDADG endonuclease [Morchella brunnea]